MGAMPLATKRADLAGALELAYSVGAACAATSAWLSDDPALMPSIYLERGGRLRCHAAARYWQVFDGIVPGVGVIGQTYLTGEPRTVGDTTSSAHYMEVAPAVRDEACVPIRASGRVIGALNVESEHRLDEDVPATLAGCAELLGRRIEALGGLPRESRSQRLARHASRIATLDRASDIRREVLRAACDVADMESALLVGQPQLGLEVTVWGPHSRALRELEPETLAKIAGWVNSMASVYTVGEPAGVGFAGHEDLRAAGAEAFVVVPVHHAGTVDRALLLVHSQPIALPTEDVELLELLALQAGSALQTAAVMTELHERAERDPLTDLGHQATFRAALCSACRGRRALALLVVDVDNFKQVNDTLGHQAGDEVLLRCATVLGADLREADGLYRIGGDEFAVLIDGADEQEAVSMAERLRGAVASLGGPTVSVGVASRSQGEEHESLFGRADAALYAAKHAGRNAVAVR